MNITGKGLAAVAGGVAAAAYLLLGFFVAASDRPPAWSVILTLLPMTALMLLRAWRMRWRWPAVLACLSLFGWVLHAIDSVRTHVAWVYFAQHVGAMCVLGLMFGMTLWGAHEEALCSRIAALVTTEPVDAAYARYTWQVTWAWTLFFVLMLAASVLLFFWGPLTWWSFLANLLTPALTGAMFVFEYLVRVRLMPDRPHMSVAGTIEAYQRFRQGS